MMNKLLLYSCLLLLSLTKASAQCWIQKANVGGSLRDYAVGFSIGTKGYIGLGSGNDFWGWDGDTASATYNTWSQIANFPGTGIEGAAGFSIGTKGYIVTGDTSIEFWEWNGNTASSTYNTWTRKANFPGSERYFAVAFSIGKKGYVGTGNYTQDFWEWDGDTASATYNTWTRKADFGGGYRGWATGFSIGKKGYIGTGTDGSYLKADFWEWDGDTASATYNTWTRKADVPGGGRENAVGFSVGNNGYIGLGLDSTTTTWLQDFWQWNQLTNTWVQKPNFSDRRQNAVGFSIGNNGYIGTGYDNTATRDFWEYCDTLCTVGVNEFNGAVNISVFPNPASDKIEVSSQQSVISSIEIYNLLGEKVYTSPFTENRLSVTFNISNIPSGVYVLHVKANKGMFYKKIVIQR